MKVLLINGGPHKNGCTYTALTEVEKTLNEEGIETEIFWVGTKPIAGCIACKTCVKNGKCVFDDVVNEFVEKLPDGIDTLIGEKGLGLSEGQVQRIAIARALLSDAPIILLDEATSALDPVTEATVLQNLKNLQEKTCLIVTHRRQALEVCNKKLEIKAEN